MEIYLVGGAVRDAMLGRAFSERDWVVVGATHADMRARGFKTKDAQFAVYLHPETGDEYTLARRERKITSGHRGFEVVFTPDVDLEDDLARRDLTVNAMARDASGALRDPFSGADDLERRVLRHVTSAFVEDPVRVLRLARFSAELAEYDFEVDPQTGELAHTMCAGDELASLSGARVWRETARALHSTSPIRFFERLRDWGGLDRLMPELVRSDCDFTALAQAIDALKVSDADRVDARLALLFCSAHRADASHDVRTQAMRLGERYKLERGTRELLVAAGQPPPSRADDAEQVLTWMESTDALRKSSRWRTIVMIHAAMGAFGDNRADVLLAAADAVRSVRIPAPVTADAMRRARIDALGRCLEPGR